MHAFISHLLIFWTSAVLLDAATATPTRYLLDLVPRIAFNQLCGVLPTILFLQAVAPAPRAHPGPLCEELVRLGAAVALGELAVFAVHVTFHKVPWLWKNVHLVHHRPMRSSAHALYATLPEVVVLNMLCTFGPFVLCGVDRSWMRGAECLGTFYAVYSHSKIRGFPHGHDLHHAVRMANYATFTVADWAFGTRKTA